MTDFTKARGLLETFKGGRYLYGMGVLSAVGPATAALGSRAALVSTEFPGSDGYVWTIRRALARAGVDLVGSVAGPRPNAPTEDLARITDEMRTLAPDVVVSFGGGSTIDAAKAAITLWLAGRRDRGLLRHGPGDGCRIRPGTGPHPARGGPDGS